MDFSWLAPNGAVSDYFRVNVYSVRGRRNVMMAISSDEISQMHAQKRTMEFRSSIVKPSSVFRFVLCSIHLKEQN